MVGHANNAEPTRKLNEVVLEVSKHDASDYGLQSRLGGENGS